MPFIQYLFTKSTKAYLIFFVEERLKFLYLPNGYGLVMQILTKISKLTFSSLRENGFLFVAYFNCLYLQEDDHEDCLQVASEHNRNS